MTGEFLGEGLLMKIFAKKIGTTHYYTDNNKHQIVTVLELENSIVGKIKTTEKDGYNALVVVSEKENAKVKKSVKGQFKSLNPIKISEVRVEEIENKQGDSFSISDLAVGDVVSVSGRTKGKGFQGTVRRHGFNTGPKTHGSRNYRRPGSIGMTTPSRVVKGKSMAGHTGAVNATQKKVTIERIDADNNHIWVKGHIMGPNKASLIIVK